MISKSSFVISCPIRQARSGLIDVSTGNKVLLSPKTDEPEFYDYPQFTKDGKGVFVLTDHDSDVRRIARIDLASHKFTYIPSDAKWDVDEFQISPDGKTVAFIRMKMAYLGFIYLI